MLYISFLAGSATLNYTQNSLKKLLYGHRSTINTKRVDTPLGLHFNLTNPSILDMSVQSRVCWPSERRLSTSSAGRNCGLRPLVKKIIGWVSDDLTHPMSFPPDSHREFFTPESSTIGFLPGEI